MQIELGRPAGMQTEEIFYRYVWIVADEWCDKKDDWPQIENAIESLPSADIERDKALALLIGLRAGERQKASSTREGCREEILAELRFAKGSKIRSDIRRRAKALALKRIDQIQSKIIFGFFLDRGRNTVSQTDLNALLEAVECVWHAGTGDRRTKLARVYGQFRSRVNRLKQSGGTGSEDAAKNIFGSVYNIMIDYI